MREASRYFILQLSALLILCCTHGSNCSSYSRVASSSLLGLNHYMLSLLPQITPSPLMPFTNNGVPILSGLCTLDFSAHESLLNTTATDCWGPFAPYVSNAICCPQYKATLTILIGNSSMYLGELGLNSTVAKHCLSDIDQILQSRGASKNVCEMCSISPTNLTQGSCPVTNVNEIDQIVDYSRLVAKCRKIDVPNECCTRVCQKEISDAAFKIASQGYHNTSSGGAHFKSKLFVIIKDCENVILRWLVTKLDQVSMNNLLRGISSCEINKVCPLLLPDASNVSKNCGNRTSNHSACCNATEIYMSRLQNQTLLTNLQALNCAELLGITLQNANVTQNIYNLCRITLTDFSLQVMGASVSSRGSGCLLPSLPSDATYDDTYGISFVCDLNDNVAAPWPSTSFSPASSCNNSSILPALPKAASTGTGVDVARTMFPLVILILLMFA